MGNVFKYISQYSSCGNFSMKKENCPFCGHRWIRKSGESPIKCPNCHSKYYSPEELAKRRKDSV